MRPFGTAPQIALTIFKITLAILKMTAEILRMTAVITAMTAGNRNNDLSDSKTVSGISSSPADKYINVYDIDFAASVSARQHASGHPSPCLTAAQTPTTKPFYA